ncbi:exonuclease SbcCD subunit D [Agrobacterium vitis]|uniref:exonuclease SbcCD subunit D n=1 Tax=Agrobacterium vitis TaxID=373 RepID=UPI00157464F6|nr:exonuclease SbcCD subunit D [Agrobacterium vitis]NSZ17961.1 exonuclease SbcCD subunit D [Agrobacterium vitis]QZO03620.1 exonuclease SbcCD subunit D [Agrobacterium vitis]UJL88744.1 exonuclease SbcCD subunit D [Agrobacterium vitis]
MKILHTADLHLGRQLNGLSLDEDQDAILDQIVDALRTTRADILIIAGDIFDRAAPPATAVRQFNAFLSRVAAETTAAVAIIAGNHDSGDRIGAMAIMTDRQRALIQGPVARDMTPLVLHDAHGPVAFSAMPFAYEFAARECFADPAIATPQDVLAAQVADARRSLPEGARWVVIAHAFVAGGTSGDTERPLARVGGIETVSPEIFEGAHYVALGHLHRPQHVSAPHIRYSGSPLAFSFGEASEQKSMTLIDLDADGQARIETIDFNPPRAVRLLRGLLADLLLAQPSQDFIKAVLTDPTPLIDPMKRLRAVFPNACQLTYARDERAPELKFAISTATPADPLEVIADFIAQVRDEPISEPERALVTAMLDELDAEETAA